MTDQVTGNIDDGVERPKLEVEIKTGIKPPAWFKPTVSMAQLNALGPARRSRRT